MASRVCAMNAETSEARKFSPVAAPDHQRGVAAGADDDVGHVGVHGDEGERALEPAQTRRMRLGQARARRLGHDLAEQVGDDLGVGVGGHLDAAGLELVAQLGEVLDDPVVDHRDLAGRGPVRVGVAVGRAAVGGPAGVAHAAFAEPSGSASSSPTRLASLPALRRRQLAVADQRHARRSRTRGTPAAAAPEHHVQGGASAPTYPTIPHMLIRIGTRAPTEREPPNVCAGRVILPAAGRAGRSSASTARDDRGQPVGDLVRLVRVGASTMTRTSGSVPDGRSSTRPVVAQLRLGGGDRGGQRGVAPRPRPG